MRKGSPRRRVASWYAHALELDDDSFDLTGSQFGVMLVPDQPLALREMVRVTKPGGRVLLIAYGSPA